MKRTWPEHFVLFMVDLFWGIVAGSPFWLALIAWHIFYGR